MDNNTILIIGAGAAGLMAAKELSAKGEKVILLEARNRLGGRIHTEHDPAFSSYIELGAEFVHGDLPITKGLIKEAGISMHKTGGEMWRANDSRQWDAHTTDHWKLFESRMQELEEDMTVNDFLSKYFDDDKYESLRNSVRGYATGYDSADPDKASTIALREEWLSEEDEDQYRRAGGYGQIADHLAASCTKQGCAIHLQTVVKQIQWQKGAVSVISTNGTEYKGKKVIITLPINVLQADAGEPGAITFSPVLPRIMDAVQKMGMGAIIKILFEFKTAFWKDEEVTKRVGKNLGKTGFILSGEIIPTWWTQYPGKAPLLTGWLGGPEAKTYEHTSDEEISMLAINSLAAIFKTSPEYIKQQLRAWKVVNWTADIYSRGSYSYDTVTTKQARKIMEAAIDDTIYFAGEAMYDGPVMGTIEAALVSGKDVAKKILS